MGEAAGVYHLKPPTLPRTSGRRARTVQNGALPNHDVRVDRVQ